MIFSAGAIISIISKGL